MQELLYHGTTRGYHMDQIKRFGRYQHIPLEGIKGHTDNYRVQLARDPETGMSFAVQRSQQYSDSPILLIVKQTIITPESRLAWIPYTSCDFLDKEWYRVFDIKLFDGKANLGSLEGLREMEEEVMTL